ncbi:LicD family protein [Lysinibacillus sp. NPDC092081]|uniref:LicD family protein n=1 Tax=Lysinibacillus sp. NPDC092081 TaxID=3364131 RepID=UPI00382FD9C6
MKKILLYGAGSGLQNFFEHYKGNDIEILGIIDASREKWGMKIQGNLIKSPDVVREFNYDEIWITSMFVKEIKEKLLSLGVEPEKICAVPKNLIVQQMYPFENTIVREAAIEILFNLTDIFNQHNVNYFIDAGTLLGIIREQDLIKWDNDIDLCIPFDDVEKVQQILKKNLFQTPIDTKVKIKERYDSKNSLICFELMFCMNNIEFEMSIGILRFENDTAYTILNVVNQKHFITGEELMFKGKKLRVPNKPLEYLTTMYGNWRIPKRDSTFEDFNSHTSFNSKEYKNHYYIDIK